MCNFFGNAADCPIKRKSMLIDIIGLHKNFFRSESPAMFDGCLHKPVSKSQSLKVGEHGEVKNIDTGRRAVIGGENIAGNAANDSVRNTGYERKKSFIPEKAFEVCIGGRLKIDHAEYFSKNHQQTSERRSVRGFKFGYLDFHTALNHRHTKPLFGWIISGTNAVR